MLNELKNRIEETGRKIGRKANQVLDGVKEAARQHPVEATAIAMAMIGEGINLTAKGIRHHQRMAETRELRRRVYDPTNGMYTFTKRDLKPSEKAMIDRIHRETGESVTSILYRMNLSK